MKRTLGLALAVTIISILPLGWTWAAPGDGFGLFAGFAQHTSKGEFTPTGTEFEFESSGLSLGIDYQFMLGGAFSISPFYLTSVETAEEKSSLFSSLGVEAESAVHTVLGVQLRLWFDSLFVGGHVGRYTEVIQFDSGDAGFVGTGFGAIVGLEQDGGLFFSAQMDSAELTDEDDVADTTLTAFRVHVGYRWK